MLNKIKKIDWIITLILLALMAISYYVIHSATSYTILYAGFEKTQLMYFGLGFFVVFSMLFIDYRIFLKLWWLFYLIGVASLVLIFVLGDEINGAKGWFSIGRLSVQPAEVVKIFLIIGIAYLLGRRQGELLRFRQDILPIGLFSIIPFALVMAQPDLGNAIIYFVIVVGMLWMGNVKYWHALIGIGIIVGALMLFMFLFTSYNDEIKEFFVEHNKPHWYERINTFVHPEEASYDARLQSENAQQAIGSGGLSGQGYLQGSMKNGGFIPYTYSDSIFVVIGEEFGFQGSALLLLLYFMLIYRMIIVAFSCKDRRASYIIIGIVSMYVFQIFQNIGMMIGIMPITGITLPFISYGGTSLMINMFSIGIVFSIRAHQHQYELED
ncbi:MULTISPECIES: FtsW/RodA/SpoVE family cell cycle protein [Paenibacillus]|uniref:FtsW/RodA/SpoVE family cell cycle protein n=1 Tax=Paenibacillus TaxID=44249 RepID=UPI00203D6605|nr:rod shape-determining protein RodA [Paenibacillus camelliae]